MDKIFQLILETSFDGDKRFKSFPHRTKDGANSHRKKLLNEYLSLSDCKVDENPINKKHDEIFAEDGLGNYVFLKIEEKEILK